MKYKRSSFVVLALFLSAGVASAQESEQRPTAPLIPTVNGHPMELNMHRAASVQTDLRTLPSTPPPERERPEHEDPPLSPIKLPGTSPPESEATDLSKAGPVAAAPAPSPSTDFDGLDFANWGAGHPPDPNGDVGPTYYIQTINTSIGIFRKSDGARVAAFSFDTFMSQGQFGNLCDTDNFGDPVVLYDSFEDRWIITDFAFQLDGSGNVVNPPGAFQCFAVSKTGDPVGGGWNFYSIQITDALNDYPKFGVWPDGLYMSANMFGFAASGSYISPRVWAFNKAQMYAGAPTVQIVSFDAPASDFTLLPSNARLQTGTPPPGTPNYFVSTWQFLNALSVYKFHVDWDKISASTFTGPDAPQAATSWPNAAVPNAPSLGGNSLDVLQIRAMVQNQYANLSGVESLWVPHTVRRQNITGFAAPRWYQVDVTGGTVAANLPQAATWDPDNANVMYRFMPSLAINRMGDMALGYSTSNSTTKPAIKYAGRLATDPINTFSQTEQVLIQGAGTQTGNCGGSSCQRWGDYSAMTLDPDGCTFWYTNEYYAVDGLNSLTRIGSFAYPSCTPVSTGTLQGTVTATVGGTPISGATIAFGSRTTTTNGSGFYQFLNIPAGTYPSETASAPGYNPSTAINLLVTGSNTTTQNFSLGVAPASACLTDTTQSDFQTGVQANVDLTTSPGDVILSNVPVVDQSNTAGTTTGTGFSAGSWGGQTFIPAVTGQLVKVDVQLFCNGCTGTTPNLTLSIRNTSGGLPTGTDLATTTIPGFSNGAGAYYTGTFGSPPTLTSGTQYALILRPVANPSVGGYFWIRSSPSTYANGQRVISTDNGVTWTADSTRDFNFKAYMQTGFAVSGTQVSSLKDSNPPLNQHTQWQTLSWTAATPANTSLQFQVAASNSSTGPFNFVGPNGTAATFFTTSSASLSQFNSSRYLRYKAYLATSNGTVTPTLNDVTVCYVIPPDLSITKSDGVTTATPGGSVTYTIVASNAGPSNATGATVADAFPATLSCTWTCAGAGGGACTASGAGNINDTVNLPSGGSATYTASCTVAASATGTLSNTATVATPGGVTDPTPGNNSATDSDTLTPQANLAITKTDGVTTVAPGGSVTYTIVASNAGPSNATGATVADTFPATLSCTWTCAGAGGGACPASGAGNINDTVNLPSGGSATYTASCTVSASATGTLSNTATVATPGGVTDPTPGNNSATDSDTLTPQANLAITKSDGVTTVAPGGSVTYTIVASNAGPSNATGATVADTFPATLSCTWTCAGAGGGACPASGAGNINDTVNLPSGGSATYTASCTVAASATGTLSNTATVAAPGGVTDPTPGNNSATDSDTLTPQANLAITKTDGVTTVAPGGSVTYTIVASNAGPSNAAGVTVADAFPATLSCTWTCAGAGGGACPASGAGNINNNAVNLPAGGSATYTAACSIGASATGTLSNTATVSAPGGITDPTPGNNSATDTDTLAASADLSITKTDGSPTYVAGNPISYTLVVSNAGPSNATGVSVADAVPATITGVAVNCVASGTANCGVNASSGNAVSFTGASLPVGAANHLTITVSGTVNPTTTGNLVNTATVTAGAGQTDPTPGNNSATDTDSPSGPNIFDPPSGRKTVDTAGLPVLEWRMVWINNGNTVANLVRVIDPIPAGTTYVTGSLQCTPTGTSTVTACLEPATAQNPQSQIVYEGSIAPDPGAISEGQAQNEVVIVFQTRLDTGVTTASNTANAYWDRNGNGNLGDDNNASVTASATAGNPGAVGIPTLHPLILTVLATALAWLMGGLRGRLWRRRL